MLGMLTHGRLFLSTFLAESTMYQVVLSVVAESGCSLRVSRWEKCGNIWCVIGGTLFSYLDTVLDDVAAGCDSCPKSVCCCSLEEQGGIVWEKPMDTWKHVYFLCKHSSECLLVLFSVWSSVWFWCDHGHPCFWSPKGL